MTYSWHSKIIFTLYSILLHIIRNEVFKRSVPKWYPIIEVEILQ